MTQPSHNHSPRALTLTRAAGIDIAMLVFGGAAVVLSFLTGQGADRWQNLVFPPVVMVLAVITLRLVLAEIRALVPVLPDHPHKGEAVTALGVAIVMTVVVGPMLLIMPFIFFAAL
jgi:hypothetical protein